MTRTLRMLFLALSMYSLVILYAQVGLESLRNRFEEHLQVSAQRVEQLNELDRRVDSLETVSRKTLEDVADLKATAEFTRTLMLCLGAPILLIAIETLIRMVSKRRES